MPKSDSITLRAELPNNMIKALVLKKCSGLLVTVRNKPATDELANVKAPQNLEAVIRLTTREETDSLSRRRDFFIIYTIA